MEGTEVLSSSAAQPPQRITSFNGARGLMAAIVVIWHCYLVLTPYLAGWLSHSAGPVTRWVWTAFGPTDLTQAISTFFIFSGLVVSLPALRAGFEWLRYYPARFLRLYLPACAALLLAYLLVLIVPRVGHAPVGSWLAVTNAQHASGSDLLWSMSLLAQPPKLDNPLWSVTWEVAFSAALPLFIIISRATTRAWLWVMAGSVFVVGVGTELHLTALTAMPPFLIGAVAAANLDKVTAAMHAVANARHHTLWWALIVAGSVVSVMGSQVTHTFFTVKPYTVVNHLLADTSLLGYMGFIFTTMGCVSAVRFFNLRALQFLGVISFALYLVHVPIIASLGYAFHDGRVWLVPVIAVPLALGSAILFTKFIEQPAHRLARRAGRAAVQHRHRELAPPPVVQPVA